MEINNELTMATISVYAFIRHQNHRRIYISPFLHPILRAVKKACPALVKMSPNPAPRVRKL